VLSRIAFRRDALCHAMSRGYGIAAEAASCGDFPRGSSHGKMTAALELDSPGRGAQMSDPGSPDEAAGDTDALFAAVYDRLKAMAGRQLARGARGTLDTTELVHDLYLRLGHGDNLVFARPEQFLAYAARAMRHLLADRARDRQRQRAGGDWVRVTLTGRDERLVLDSAEEALALDAALGRLEADDARTARVAELAWFAGLDQERIAATLDISLSTVARDLRFARAFLKAELGGWLVWSPCGVVRRHEHH